MNKISRRNFMGSSVALALLGGVSSQFLTGCGSCCKKKPYRLGVADWTLGMRENPASFDVAKKIGLDGVQVSFSATSVDKPLFTKALIDEYSAKIKETGLGCASTSFGSRNSLWQDEDVLKYTRECIDAAQILGASTILLPFFGKSAMTDKDKKIRKECFDALIPRLKELAPYAKDKNVSIALETTLSASDHIRVIDAVGSDFIKVYFDTFNCEYYGFNTVEDLKKLDKYIAQIHLKDKGHKLDSHSGMPQNFDACFAAIDDMEYNDWLVFETHGFKDGRDGILIDVLKHNLSVVKNSVLFK